MSSGRPLTPDEVTFIKKCISEGTTATYCALKLNRSPNSVIGHAGRIDLHFPGRKSWPRKYG
jgi:hypothetical protein